MKRILQLLALTGILFSSSLLYAQDRTVSGKITSADDGSPIPGANVLLKGTTNGTVTDIDGNYKLTVPSNGATLIVSFIGYGSKEIPIGARAVIDVALETDITELSEVVVTAFGVEKEKKALGYAVEDVGSQELVKSQTRSAIQAIQGKVAGVQITNASGAPGASTNIVLRGTSSLTGNNQALFIIDGVPVNNSNNNAGGILQGAVDGGNAINDLNPEDIESMSILKGASAAALYGSRAANGVVIITTKKGKNTNGKINIDYNTSYQFERVLVLPTLQNQFGQGQAGDNLNFLNDQESWGDAFNGELRPYGSIILDPASEYFNTQRVKPYDALPDNLREFWDIGTMFTNSLALSGGTENAKVRLSLSDLKQTGVVPGTELKRNTFAINSSAKMDKFDFGVIANYVRQKNDLAINGQGGESPYNQVIQTSRSISIIEQRDLSNPYNGVDWYYTPFIQNPYFNLFNDSYVKTLNRIYGNFNIGYQPIEMLRFTAKLGVDHISDNRKRVKERRIASALSPNGGANEPGFIQNEAWSNDQIDANFTANFNKDLTSDINLNVLVGYNYNERSGSAIVSSVNATSIPGFDDISNGSSAVSSTESRTKRRLLGAYAQADFSYKGFWFLGATFRNDWSSTLPKENNSFSYPSVYTSFVLTDAVDLGIENILTYAKFRASYAKVGNDAPPYSTASVFFAPQGGPGSSITGNFGRVDFPLNGVPGFTEGNVIGNPNLTPEFTTELEFGTDLRFLNDRIGIDLTYFTKKSEDQIVTVQAPPSSGFSFQVLNSGTIENKGWEVLLKGTPIKTADWRWDISVNYTKIESLVSSLPSGDLTIGVGLANYQLKAIEGEPYGIFEAPTALRDPNGNLVVDGNGLPQQAPAPEHFGSVQPDWLGGLTTSLSFKGFTLSATFDHKQGGNVYSRTAGSTYFNGTAVETAFNNRERFIVPFSVVDNGDGTYSPNTVPLTYASNNIRQYWNVINGFGEYLIFDGSYTKLRELSLSYDLSKSLLKPTPFTGVNVSIYGRNLWINTPKRNTFIDPEVNSFTSGNTNVGNLTGFEFGTTPSTSTYGVSVRLSL
ncbi:MAG: SusC/RagA family TonB-linked outer membrane protein [Cyclobacteriaceae bacterium]|nr:SusC/RagA family TonB-linked outer membrane protein [Cyclobacteriaceae bacterium]